MKAVAERKDERLTEGVLLKTGRAASLRFSCFPATAERDRDFCHVNGVIDSSSKSLVVF